MPTFLARRLGFLVFVILGVSVLTFVVSHVVPADPAAVVTGKDASPQKLAQIRHTLGLDQPLPVQYVTYMGNLLHGDLGISSYSRRPVLQDFLDYFPATVELTFYALLISVAVVLGSAPVIGLLVGSLAGYMGGLADDVLIRVTDIFLAFPGVVLALAIAAALGPGLTSAMLALAAIWWPTYARLVRGQVLALKNNAYAEAARSLGASNARIVVVHIWRNGIAPILVQLTLDMGNVLVSFAGLSFLGLGAAVGTPEWGAMVSAGQSYLMTNWWLSTFPGLAIFVTALLLNMLGDTIQDLMSSGATRI